MRSILLPSVLLVASLRIVQGGQTVTGAGNAADSEQVTKLKKRLEELESRTTGWGSQAAQARRHRRRLHKLAVRCAWR